MDGASLELLVECGLRHRFPEECKQWNERKIDIHQVFETDIKQEATQIENRLQANFSQLERLLHEAIVDAIIRPFPYVTISLFQFVVEFYPYKVHTFVPYFHLQRMMVTTSCLVAVRGKHITI